MAKRATTMERCGGCGSTRGYPEATRGLYSCKGCGGLVGTCYLGEFNGRVLPWFAPLDVPSDRLRYYDVTTLGSAGIERRHGWYDVETRLVVQVG